MTKFVGQRLLIGLRGETLTAEEKKQIVENNIGGVILFARNCKSAEQVHELVREIQALRFEMPDKVPLFISIDMEGGRVARLKSPFTEWPPLSKIAGYDSTSLAFRFAQSMGHELKAFGINLNFAPCVDVLGPQGSEVIGDRSAGSDPEVVAKIGSALVRGYIKGGVEPCGKHFPGHGFVKEDSHEELPVDERSLDEIRECEFISFKKVFRARLNFVMSAHIKYPKIDPEWPASLSPRWTAVLRDELKYRQLLLSDDLDMKALTKHYDKKTIATQAVRAGANILLYCNDFDSPWEGIEGILEAAGRDEISKASLEEGHQRIVQFKKDHLTSPIDPLPLAEALGQLGLPTHKTLSEGLVSGQIPEDWLKT